MSQTTSSKSSQLPLIIVGDGGHASVLLEALEAQGKEVLGATSRSASAKNGQFRILGDDASLEAYPPDTVRLVCGVGSTGNPSNRLAILRRFRLAGYKFESVIHPSAIISSSATIQDGAQVMAGAVVGPRVVVASDVIINTGALVDHDCQLESLVHVAVGAILCGNVRIGEKSHVGAGATVLQGIEVGSEAIVAAGAVVTRNVARGTTVLGVPARRLKDLK